MDTIKFKLRYALGEIATGLGFETFPSSEPLVVKTPSIDSPSYRAGIRDGDKIIEMNGIRISNSFDYERLFNTTILKQGDILSVTFERNGRTQEVEVKFPVIPKPSVEHKYEDQHHEKPVEKAI